MKTPTKFERFILDQLREKSVKSKINTFSYVLKHLSINIFKLITVGLNELLKKFKVKAIQDF